MASRQQDQGGYRTYSAPSSENADSISVIDQYSNFDGTYHSTRDLRIEGNVKGTIECRGTLHVAQGASVNAKVEAENISVAGELDGEITCRGRLQLLPSGRVKGQIRTQTLVIHEGAYYEGDLEMGSSEGRGGSRVARRSRPTETPAPASSSPAQAHEDDRPADEPSDDAPVRRDETSETTVTASPQQSSTPNTFIRRFGGQEQQFDTRRPAAPSDDEQRTPDE